jgi:hypothetical protein
MRSSAKLASQPDAQEGYTGAWPKDVHAACGSPRISLGDSLSGSQSGVWLNDLSRRGSWARLHDGRKVFEDRDGEG